MKNLLLLVVLFPTLADADEINMTCNFSRSLIVYHDNPKAEPYDVTQSLKIINGKTSKETLALDGSMRATNSRTWIKLHTEFIQKNSTDFVGNDGDVINISHSEMDYGKKLTGSYEARGVSLSKLWTNISKGRCQLE